MGPAVVVRESRVSTGNTVLDSSLEGGLPAGSLILVEGEDGAGAAEFAFAVLRAAAARGAKARFLSALRSPLRIRREAHALFENEGAAAAIDVRGANGATHAMKGATNQATALAVSDLGEGDVLAVESVSALLGAGSCHDLAGFVQKLGDTAAERGAVVLLLHALGSVPAEVASVVRENADGRFDFTWRLGQNARRRYLTVPKLRGLAPVLEGEQVPVFEVELVRGAGYRLSRVNSVL
ncbi:MAG TPA: hypothetical protein VI997_10085 [Candidatus Thermoplasmatota archaeon]|nr:hypothetical protein [Candidatus Thermoplasmatota archaeon]